MAKYWSRELPGCPFPALICQDSWKCDGYFTRQLGVPGINAVVLFEECWLLQNRKELLKIMYCELP